ncbi:phosphatidylinositol N-acetylglucosaminyltransferase subunit C [Contarinia nasturtii]|uniref:phosphatidylinositol N-acetylglucosaminyltransferase subunit C n=1 Tax=Contarinia nasturtii TaxID=265458 RepID=UPI0012D375AC|nr:phosphatidylinositol N-acetylglucosaminyltransferase subunit C [Contarinia nasturtii]
MLFRNSVNRQIQKMPVSQLHPKKSWQKTLYGNRSYFDNYTDSMFLKDLQKNKNVEFFNYLEAVLGATKLIHQFSLIAVFLLVFHNLYVRPSYITAASLLLVVFCICCSCYICFILWNGPRSCGGYLETIRDDTKTVTCVLVFGFILSPMLHTLTKSISTDTIYTITFFVFLLHIVCYDYGMPAALVSRAISLNAAIFGTICLASRLNTSLDAFVLLIVSFTLFAVYPHLICLLESHSKFYLLLIPVAIFVSASSFGLLMISPNLFFINFMVSFFCGMIYPFIFCYAQKYKNNIHGPWDEAVLVK